MNNKHTEQKLIQFRKKFRFGSAQGEVFYISKVGDIEKFLKDSLDEAYRKGAENLAEGVKKELSTIGTGGNREMIFEVIDKVLQEQGG